MLSVVEMQSKMLKYRTGILKKCLPVSLGAWAIPKAEEVFCSNSCLFCCSNSHRLHMLARLVSRLRLMSRWGVQ